MEKSKLIKELQKLPDGINICICDIRKNAHYAGDEEGTP